MQQQKEWAQRRGWERFRASRDVELEGTFWTFQGVLKDVSIEGFKMAIDGVALPNQPVRLIARGLPPLPATILWRRYGLIGCRFAPDAEREAILRLIRRPLWSDELPTSALYCDLPENWPEGETTPDKG